jgi:hypothetical protein
MAKTKIRIYCDQCTESESWTADVRSAMQYASIHLGENSTVPEMLAFAQSQGVYRGVLDPQKCPFCGANLKKDSE